MRDVLCTGVFGAGPDVRHADGNREGAGRVPGSAREQDDRYVVLHETLLPWAVCLLKKTQRDRFVAVSLLLWFSFKVNFLLRNFFFIFFTHKLKNQ